MKKGLAFAAAIGLACLFSLVLSSCMTAPTGGSFSPNSVTGIWTFNGSDHTLTFSQDFTMVHRDGENIQVDYGTWKFLSDDKKTVQLTWALSENVDTLTISANGRSLSGADDAGGAISCSR
jgi:hypothetical protein